MFHKFNQVRYLHFKNKEQIITMKKRLTFGKKVKKINTRLSIGYKPVSLQSNLVSV